jgi:hypothetical protein
MYGVHHACGRLENEGNVTLPIYDPTALDRTSWAAKGDVIAFPSSQCRKSLTIVRERETLQAG